MLNVFLNQKATKVIVGDTHQQIYGWRYAVNSLEKAVYKTFNLSTSFRFSQDIADLAMDILSNKDDFAPQKLIKIKGKGAATVSDTKAILARTNLGLLLAVEGADVLKSTGFVGIPLVVAFILVVSLINFLIGSSSAKWALLAPIFVPMFMQVNFSPAYTQAAFRIADSVTNSISPLEPFMPFIIVLAQRYDKRVGLGTIISTMIPHAFFFLISWIILLVIWALLNLPLGPGTMINLL